MTTPKLLSDVRDGILTLSLNRPEKLNAIDPDLAHALLEAISAADQGGRAEGEWKSLLCGP